MANIGRIDLKQLKGFQNINNNEKIVIELFLESAKEIVAMIDSFGKLFKPIVYDMNGNIEKLNKHYTANISKVKYLDDMIIADINNPDNITISALLWLKRALELIEQFFTNILNDNTYKDNLKEHLKGAYKATLQKYHGWLVQETFSMIYGFIPSRTQLFGTANYHTDNMKALEEFLPPMRSHLVFINDLYAKYKLDDTKKV